MKTIIPILLTLFLGPGVGHFYIRQFKRGIIFVAATLLFAIHLSIRISRAIRDMGIVDIQNVSHFIKEFTMNNPKIIFYYDAILAAIWAFAIIDVYRLARNKQEKKQDENIENQKEEQENE